MNILHLCAPAQSHGLEVDTPVLEGALERGLEGALERGQVDTPVLEGHLEHMSPIRLR